MKNKTLEKESLEINAFDLTKVKMNAIVISCTNKFVINQPK